MTGIPIVHSFLSWWKRRLRRDHLPPQRDLHTHWRDQALVSRWAALSPPAFRLLDLLGPLHWAEFPERNLIRNWGQPTLPYAALAAAWLIQLNEGLVSMSLLRRYLVEHPLLIWLLGFPLAGAPEPPWGFDPQASLPTARHLTHLLRSLPNAPLQFLLVDSVTLICAELCACGVTNVGECVSLDTKHILAWVKENNPKAYVSDRYDKTKQPAGDPDCRLGCKRRRNQSTGPRPTPPTPTTNPLPASTVKAGEFYWGYGTGVVVTKVPTWGEFVIAEWTQPFDCGDVTYFFPLMAQTEQRLGFRPRWATFDAAFDAFYVYEYFYRADDPAAFAAVPFSERGGYKAGGRQFTPEGLPLCRAGLPMPLKFTYTDRTSAIIEHERAKYTCPLRAPDAPAAAVCPINHKNWAKQGCTAMMPTSIGARIRYQLDREGPAYKGIYKQRTATERINSQAVALGIERPHLRNQQAITNRNTLIYILINLRFLQRIRQRLPESP